MHLTYLLVLGGCLLVTAPLELFLGTRVYPRWRRVLAAVTPPFLLFLCWDLYAIARHQWRFDPRQILGLRLPGHVPVEELAFFVIIPLVSIVAFEAVRAVRGYPAGDEPEPQR